MLAVCAAFAVIATIMQIWAEIHSEDSAHIAAQDQISQNFAPLVASALMDGRASDVTDAVRLILSLNPVHDANIILAHGDKAELAAVWGSARHFESQVFPLVHRGEDVGTLNVIWSPKTASTNIAATIQRHLFVNLLESMIIGMLMLVIFDRLAARHLKAIADQVRSTPWMDTDNPRWLKQGTGIFPDQIDSIIHALDYMRNEAKSAYSSLRKQVHKTSELNASLRDANREQAELTYALSHDLITPVNTLDTLLREVLAEASALDDETLHCLQDMHLSTKRMRQQIEAVQKYAHLLQEPCKSEAIDLNVVFDAVITEMAHDLADIQAEVDILPLGVVTGDFTGLREMARQLIGNSIAYRDKTRPLAITVTPVPCELNGQISFEIRDTGLGIHADHCEAVFGLFRRLHTHGEIPGNGMGLPLTRRIVDRHGGRIHLSSVPGAGTTITISLPEST